MEQNASEHIRMSLKARGEFLKLLLLCAISFLLFSHLDEIPKTYVLKVMKKRHVIDLTYVKLGLQILSGLVLGYALYLIALVKSTIVDFGRINLTLAKGLLLRCEDTLNLVIIQDIEKERSLLDMILGISKIIILSKDLTSPKLTLKGLTKADADRLYEHLILYSNRNMVEYLQGSAERKAYTKRQKLKEDPTWRRGLVSDDDTDE